MKNKQGKIIAIVGGPASGKSTLIKSLGKEYKINVFMEGEETDLPDYVKNNIAKGKNGLQTILFFHNQSVAQYLEAIRLKEKGEIVLLDTFWLSNIFYLDTMLKDKNEIKLMEELIRLTSKTLPMPDVIIYLEASDKIIKDRLEKRGREFEKDFLKDALKINKSHIEFFKKHRNEYLGSSQVIKIPADGYNIKELGKKLNLD